MKNATLLIVLFSLVLITSCNKKEEEQDRANIIGMWVANFISVSGCTGGGSGTQDELTCSEDNCISYSFDSEGIYIINETSDGETFGEQGTYSIKDGKVNFCLEDEGIVTCTSGSFDVNSATFTLTITHQDTGCTTQYVFDRELGEQTV